MVAITGHCMAKCLKKKKKQVLQHGERLRSQANRQLIAKERKESECYASNEELLDQ